MIRISGAGVLASQMKSNRSSVLASQVKSNRYSRYSRYSSPLKTTTTDLKYNGDVVIGEVRSSFSDEGFENVKVAPSTTNTSNPQEIGKGRFDDAGPSGSFDDNSSELKNDECDKDKTLKC